MRLWEGSVGNLGASAKGAFGETFLHTLQVTDEWKALLAEHSLRRRLASDLVLPERLRLRRQVTLRSRRTVDLRQRRLTLRLRLEHEVLAVDHWLALILKACQLVEVTANFLVVGVTLQSLLWRKPWFLALTFAQELAAALLFVQRTGVLVLLLTHMWFQLLSSLLVSLLVGARTRARSFLLLLFASRPLLGRTLL